jgi:hypothetical protein
MYIIWPYDEDKRNNNKLCAAKWKDNAIIAFKKRFRLC